jgi:beta-carotene hydroxylase
MRTAMNSSINQNLPTLHELGGDLLHVTPAQQAKTLMLPFLAMGGYWLFASLRCWPLAIASVMILSFVTYGSSSHDLVHRVLRLPHGLNDIMLTIIELLSLRSGTAYRLSHLHHHQHLLADDDIEGATAHGSLLAAIVSGPFAQIQLWRWAWHNHQAMRRRLFLEALGVVTLIALAITTVPWSPTPAIYVALVIAGSWLFPLITVYIPHDAHAKEPLRQTRLFRGRLVQLIAFHHLYHLEHHLYPAVPHQNWKSLADRLNPYFERSGIKACGTRSIGPVQRKGTS